MLGLLLVLLLSSDIIKYGLLDVNNCIFIGSKFDRDVQNEYIVNFLNPRSQLIYVNKDTSQFNIAKHIKMTHNTPDIKCAINGITGEIPCVLLSKDHDLLQPTSKRPLILYFGGNGESIYNSFGYGIFEKVNASYKTDVLIVGYPGYVNSSDKANAENFYCYCGGMAKLIDTYLDGIYSDIVLVGFSIGCSAVVDCLNKCTANKVRCAILICPFKDILSSIDHITNTHFRYLEPLSRIFKWNVDDKMDNVKRIKNTTTPLRIVYAHSDTIVNPNDAVTLYDEATQCNDKELFEFDGDHGEFDVTHIKEMIYSVLHYRPINFSHIDTTPRLVKSNNNLKVSCNPNSMGPPQN